MRLLGQAICDAVTECGQYAAEKDKKCPLNVCCNEGFCNDKCQTNCGKPALPAGQSSHPVRDKVIVYYEAW